MGVVELRYAQALYDAARDRDRLEEVRAELADFLKAQEEIPELRSVLVNPELDPVSKADLVETLLAGSEPLLVNFVRLLAEKERLGAIDGIATELEALAAAGEKRLQIRLTTATELSEMELKALVERIEGEVGRDVDARHRVDPDLIGGLLVEAGSHRFDGSVRGRIERLRRELVHQ